MTALASRYLDRLKEKSSFESPNREPTKLTKVRCTPSCASDCAVEKNAQQGPDTELTKLTKPQNGTLVSLVSSPNGHSKSHFSSELPADDTHTEPESPIERLERLHTEFGRKLNHARLAANAEAIGNALESSLIEGSEALAKIRPTTNPAPSLSPDALVIAPLGNRMDPVEEQAA